jgi:hypothetical protein
MADATAQAAECKARGNAALSAKDFPKAIEEYTKVRQFLISASNRPHD